MVTADRRFILLSILFCFISSLGFAQSTLHDWKLERTKPDTSVFTLNGKEGKNISFKDKLGNLNSYRITHNGLYDFTLKDTGQSFFNVNLYKNQRVSAVFQVVRDSIDGLMLLFNKKGRIELALVYERSELVHVLYYRKEKILLQFLKHRGKKSPFTFSSINDAVLDCNY